MTSDCSWPKAYGAAYDVGLLPAPVCLPLADGRGAVLAEDVHADAPMPHYASSAMDGWAVAGKPPWQLQSGGPLVPHTKNPKTPGTATLIITGAAMPVGSTAVLRSESGQVDGGILTPKADTGEPWTGQHIRPQGTEAAAGDLLMEAGTVLTPAWLAVAAGSARDELLIHPQPVVDIVSTGDEVIPGGTPGPGQVRDTFSLLLPEPVRSLGGSVRHVVHVPDDPQQLAAALTRPGADVVITTGGTGTSHADHLRTVLADLGARVVVHSIAMRPGHPALLASLPNGRVVVGLPGNPLAAMMAFLTLGAPVLAKLTGRPRPQPRSSTSASDLDPLPGRHRLLPAREKSDGVSAVPRIGSGMLRGLAEADCVLVVPPAGLARGDNAQVIDLPW